MGLLVVLGLFMGACAFDSSDDIRLGQHESAIFNGFWTSFTSEEHPPLSCPSGYVVDAMQCTGSNCDNIALHCGQISTASTPGPFSGFISEEPPNNNVECGSNQFMVGVACSGRFCDNMAIQCASFTNRTRDDWSCFWSAFFSEEQRFGNTPDGYGVAGIWCKGGFCDDISMLQCRVN